jgi:hypothetical protein
LEDFGVDEESGVAVAASAGGINVSVGAGSPVAAASVGGPATEGTDFVEGAHPPKAKEQAIKEGRMRRSVFTFFLLW